MTVDLLLIADEKITLNQFEIVIAIIQNNSGKKKFYDGREPNC